MSKEIINVPPHDSPPPTERLTAAEIKADVQLIQQVLKAVMQKDVHYGVVPGTGMKPSLLKPGAEKIMATFRLNGEPHVENLSGSDEIHYIVKLRITHQITKLELGWGIGECSSNETKYKWVKPVCQEEFDATPEDRRRIKWAKGRDGRPYKMQQIRPNLQDAANTILKMAKKRALIDAVLTVTAASDIFTQDVEDMPEEIREVMADDTPGPRVQPAKETKDDSAQDEVLARLAVAKNKFQSDYGVSADLIAAHMAAKKLTDPGAMLARLSQVWTQIKAQKTTLEKEFPGYKTPESTSSLDAIEP